MTGVVLAAGRGGRLRGVTGDKPKCLVRIGEMTLLERQMRSLRACGVDQLVVVTGYRAHDVARATAGTATIVHNSRYAVSNSLYSLWLARDCLADGFVVLNGDVLFHDQLLVDLLTARYEDALLMAARRGAFSDEEMKVRVRAGRVVDIAKTLADEDADGENVGIAKFGRDGAAVVIDEMNAIVSSGAIRDWVPSVFAAFVRRRPLYVVESRGFPWIEIDFPEDYWRACSEVLPAIRENPTSCMNASITCASDRSR